MPPPSGMKSKFRKESKLSDMDVGRGTNLEKTNRRSRGHFQPRRKVAREREVQ